MYRTASLAAVEGLWGTSREGRAPSRSALLEYLFVLESADPIFLARHTGLEPVELTAHLRELASAGRVEEVGVATRLMKLTQRGRLAQDAAHRWRFRAAAVVLCAGLSRARPIRRSGSLLRRGDTDE